MVLFGKGKTDFITGGAVIVWPIIYEYYFMDLRVAQVDLKLLNVPNKDKIKVSVEAVATYKIGSEPAFLEQASRNFGDMEDRESQDKKETKVKHILESHLRSAISTLSLEHLLSERDEFNKRIQQDSEKEMRELGLEIKSFNILHVSDEEGVIDALGKKATATILADAKIEQANQKRRETIETTNADREGATTRAGNEAQIAEADKNRDQKKLTYDAEVAKQRATTEQAAPLAAAEARKGVVEAEVAVEETRAEAETRLQGKIKARTEAQLDATVITEAEANRRKALIVAEGGAAAKIKDAEGARTAAELEGEGQSKKALLIGTAEADVNLKKGTAQAEVTKQTGLATALVTKETGLAEAASTEAMVLARAKGIEAELLAQALGREKMVQAYANMDEEQRRLLIATFILDRLPDITKALGEAGAQIMAPISEAITASVAQIKSIAVYDSGGANGDGAVKRAVNMAPDILFNLFKQLEARGLGKAVVGMLGKAGIDLGSFLPAEGEVIDAEVKQTAGD
jgi:flotillin